MNEEQLKAFSQMMAQQSAQSQAKTEAVKREKAKQAKAKQALKAKRNNVYAYGTMVFLIVGLVAILVSEGKI